MKETLKTVCTECDSLMQAVKVDVGRINKIFPVPKAKAPTIAPNADSIESTLQVPSLEPSE